MAAAPHSLAEDVAELRSDVAALRATVNADRVAAMAYTERMVWGAAGVRDKADRHLAAGICFVAVATAVAFFALGLRWEAIARRCADMLAGAGS